MGRTTMTTSAPTTTEHRQLAVEGGLLQGVWAFVLVLSVMVPGLSLVLCAATVAVFRGTRAWRGMVAWAALAAVIDVVFLGLGAAPFH